MKQAKDEAQEEIENIRQKRERDFKEFESKVILADFILQSHHNMLTSIELWQRNLLYTCSKLQRQNTYNNDDSSLSLSVFFLLILLQHMGSKESVAAKIDADTRVRIDDMNRSINTQREVLIHELLDLVYDIKPQLHKNYELQMKGSI